MVVQGVLQWRAGWVARHGGSRLGPDRLFFTPCLGAEWPGPPGCPAGLHSRAGRDTRHRGSSSWVTGLDLHLLSLHRTSLIRDTGDVATCRSARYQGACMLGKAIDMEQCNCRLQAVARLDILHSAATPSLATVAELTLILHI